MAAGGGRPSGLVGTKRGGRDGRSKHRHRMAAWQQVLLRWVTAQSAGGNPNCGKSSGPNVVISAMRPSTTRRTSNLDGR